MNARFPADRLLDAFAALPASEDAAAAALAGPRHADGLTALPRPLRRKALRPLVAALAAALPLQLLAQAVPKPAATAVPIPSASWRVSGTGGAAPVNRGNAAGGVDQTISQTSKRGIYQWQSFDIGDKSSVTFDMAQTGSSALNRIGGQAPSQIFGKLTATKNGEIVLINANGILFGKGAQVDVGSLTASALNISDSEYLSGFAQSLSNPVNDELNAAFRYDGRPEDFIDAKNFVRVDEGASITTPNGGRVFLFAKKVDNAGSITTPGGQTVLGAGGSVYLKLPSSEAALYAAESNPNVSVLRGFLVEVGNGPSTSPEGGTGTASNLASGVINTPRGNTTLVGMAVNQSGRVSATTSVSENGSIILRAQGNAAIDFVSATVRATESGQLTLGAGSQTVVSPDRTLDSTGHAPTSVDTAGFVPSHLDFAGQTVLFDKGASVTAPGATVNVRAETVPTYYADLAAGVNNAFLPGSELARVVLREGATIDVSGTTDTVESVARNFVTTELLGSNDLKDAPLQKDGILYRAKVTLDIREDSRILGSLDSYRSNIARTVDERLSTGGNVRLRAEGAVLTEAGSRIDVSGGQVRYTEAQIRQTQLLGSDGKTYDLNDAPADLVYTSATNLQKSSQASYDRWGVKVAYGTVTPTRPEAGYTEGRQAGGLKIAAPTVALQGGLQAGTTQGERQLSGQAARASNGSLQIGAVVNNGRDFSASESGYTQPVLEDFALSLGGPVVDPLVWDQPLANALPAQSGADVATVQSAGFDRIEVAANRAVSLDAGAQTFQLNEGGTLRLLSLLDNVTLASNVRGAHANVELTSKQLNSASDSPDSTLKTTGGVQVNDGVRVDLSGAWVNAYGLATPLATAATVGGSFTASGYGVALGQGSVIDVSGGAAASTSGALTGAAAGSITLKDFTRAEQAEADTLKLGGALRGYSAQVSNGVATGGGSLSLQTHTVHLADALPEGASPGLWLQPGFFSQGGFGRFSVDGRLALDVAAATTIAPVRPALQVPALLPTTVLPSSGTPVSEVLQPGLPTGVRSSPVQLSLSASGDSDNPSQGVLKVGEGALIAPGAQAAVSLSAAHQLFFDGQVQARGGSVALQVKGTTGAEPNVLWLADGSRVDVSGTTLLAPDQTNGLLKGQVLAGGSITVDAGNASSLVFAKGAELDARGTTGVLDITERADGGVQTTRRTLASQGGSIAFAGNSDFTLEGAARLQAGGAGASGGALSVTLRSGVTALDAVSYDRRELQVARQTPASASGPSLDALAAPEEVQGRATVGADWIAASGAADLRLATNDTLKFGQGVQLDMAGKVELIARGLGAEAGSAPSVSGANVFMGWAAGDIAIADPTRLLGAPPATEGDASLRVQARGSMVVDGHLSTQGLAALTLHSDQDLQLRSRVAGAVGEARQGSLTTTGALNLSAAQLYPATATSYRLQADTVSISGGHAAAAPPLSAGGSLLVEARDILQAGVVRAPLGHVELRATETLTLAEGSQTSVTAQGQTLLYGTATSSTWTNPVGGALQAPPDKRLVLDAPSVVTQTGSVLDARGGGDLIATEFVPGSGGSTDILAGGNGAYALVPGSSALAAYDPLLASTAAPQGRQIEISRSIRMADGSELPAGSYTLLPARFAVLPGAFLVRPESASPSLAAGTIVTQTDGSVLVGARLADAGSTRVDTLASTWEVLDKATALRYSEIREYHAGEVFAARATKAGTAAPALPNDGGSLVVKTTLARLDGQGLFSAGQDDQGKPLGQGGRAEFIADKIQVDASSVVATDGALHLGADALNRLGAQTVVLGASSGQASAAGSNATPLTTTARSVVFAQGAQALTVPDLLASATEGIVVADGATFAPAAGGVVSGAPAAYVLQGDGAAVRVSLAPGAALTRSGVERAGGSLQVGAGARFDAPAGTLVLESTGGTSVATGAQLSAADITLGGGVVRVGAALASADQLSLTAPLLQQVAAADRLTVRGYRRIEFVGGSLLGTPALADLTLDTPALRSFGLSTAPSGAVAGTLTLTNSSGGKGAAPDIGPGELSLQASSAQGGAGLLRVGPGDISFGNAAQINLQADTAVALAGDAQWTVPGRVSLSAPAVVAEVPAVEVALNAGGVLRVESATGSPLPASADGGVFRATAQSVEMAGRIRLPSGQISLAGAQGVQLLEGASLQVQGRTARLDNQPVDLPGGAIQIASSQGNIAVAPTARLDVSGAGVAGAGGSLGFSAPLGSVEAGGTWVGQAGAEATGASLSVDAGAPLQVARIAAKAQGQFSDSVTLRQRQGDLTVGAASTLQANHLALSADAGRLTVAGTLDASGAEGGSIALDAGGDLTLGRTSRLLAQATEAGAAGGRVDLNSSAGRIQMAEGSLVDLRGGAAAGDKAQGTGGRLTLRAGVDGEHDVKIGALEGTIQGAGRIEVQAVKVYEGVVRVADTDDDAGQLSVSQVAADGSAFIGALGEHAQTMAERLANGNTAVEDKILVHSEAEIRSTGDLAVAPFTNWVLPSDSVDVTFVGGTGAHVGDQSVTLRAAGSLLVQQGIQSGFDPFGPISAAGGSIRLVAGADLGAASVMATRNDVRAGDVVFAREDARGAPVKITVRTTTGDLAVAASGDIDFIGEKRASTALFISGRAKPDDALLGLSLGAGSQAFGEGGGDLTLTAGGSIKSSEVIPGTGNVGGLEQVGSVVQGQLDDTFYTLWGSYGEQLSSGVAALGGGDLRVRAGQDIVNLVAVAPSSGYLTSAVPADPAATSVKAPTEVKQFAGGNVQVEAGRDIVNGLYAAGGSELRLRAGRDAVQRITNPNISMPGPRLYFEDTRVTALARRDLAIGRVSSRFFGSALFTSSPALLAGLDTQASLAATSVAGSLEMSGNSVGSDPTVMFLPAQVLFAAPSGSVRLGEFANAEGMIQWPDKDGSFEALAGTDLALNAPLFINASRTNRPGVQFLGAEEIASLDITRTAVRSDGSVALDQGNREPVRLAAGEGDLTVTAPVDSVRPLRLTAGQDITLSADGALFAQHQPSPNDSPSRELTLLQAGRDILFNNGLMRVGGGGDVVLLAGRDIDLGRANSFSGGSGLMAVGNTDNGLLSSGSAALTLVAGLRADGSDYGAAVRQGFHVLGATALGKRSGDVYALLSSPDAGVPALGSEAARQFSALDTAGQLAAIKTLVGEAAYNQALASYVRGLQGNSGLTNEQALAAFGSQSQARQQGAPAALLSAQLGLQPAERRTAFVTQVALQDTPRTAQALQAWMQLKTGSSLALADAVAAFETLPLERQVSWLNQMLVDEVRTQGRAAAATSGFEAEAAYLRGYQAINTVFAVDRPSGEIRLPTTQAKTFQAAETELVAATDKERAIRLGAITLMTPGGGVNAGELGATSQSANNLGIVTVAGGDISAVVRDDFLVNQSRVFSLAEGDILLWASAGDIDAGRGAKTVTGTPAPQLRLDPATGKLILDTSGSFTGSGIAVLNAASDLDLYAPAGAIDAGEAGIRATGNVFLGAQVVRGADNLQIGGNAVGAPVATATVSASAGLASAASTLAQPTSSTDDEDERRRRRLARRNLLLEFLGFGRG